MTRRKHGRDHYPWIMEYTQVWSQRARRAVDEVERRACQEARRSLENWIIYATVGKNRFSDDVPHLAVKSAWHAYDMWMMFRPKEDRA